MNIARATSTNTAFSEAGGVCARVPHACLAAASGGRLVEVAEGGHNAAVEREQSGQGFK